MRRRKHKQRSGLTSESDQGYTAQLKDILARYEINPPLTAENLLAALQELDSPYDIMDFLAAMRTRLEAEYGLPVAAAVVDELTKIHALHTPAESGRSFLRSAGLRFAGGRHHKAVPKS